MSRSRHTDEQMIGVVKQLQAGRKPGDVAREVGVSKQTICAWKAKYEGQVREAKRLCERDARLLQLIANLVLEEDIQKGI